MDLMGRGLRPNQPVSGQQQPNTNTPAHTVSRTSSRKLGGKWLRFASVGLLFSATILVVALLFYIYFGGPTSESSYINKDRMQAVFLTSGQVYFGDVTNLNDKYLRLQNVYYLRVNDSDAQQVQPESSTQQQDVSLVKLGCELHGPEDEMVVNRDDISFWENLKTDGQVAKAIDQYVKDNPDGQKCEQQTTNSTDSGTAGSETNTTPETNTNQ